MPYKDRDKANDAARERYLARKSIILSQRKAHYQTHREEVIARIKARYDSVAVQCRVKEWRLNNPDRVKRNEAKRRRTPKYRQRQKAWEKADRAKNPKKYSDRQKKRLVRKNTEAAALALLALESKLNERLESLDGTDTPTAR